MSIVKLSLIGHVAGAASLWWILTGDAWESWVVGAPVVLAAGLLSFRLASPQGWQISPSGVLRFLPYLLRATSTAGVDIASRALRPDLPLDPGVLDYQLRLPEGTSRVFFLNVVSLLPGSLSADLAGDSLTVHVIDVGKPVREELDELELRVAHLFGHPPLSPRAAP